MDRNLSDPVAAGVRLTAEQKSVRMDRNSSDPVAAGVRLTAEQEGMRPGRNPSGVCAAESSETELQRKKRWCERRV